MSTTTNELPGRQGALVSRLKVALGRAMIGEPFERCECESWSSTRQELTDCVRCNGTGFYFPPNRRVAPQLPEVKVPREIFHLLHRTFKEANIGLPLADYGFFDTTIQPYAGIGNYYPNGNPVSFRLVKDNLHEQRRQDAVALASNEAAYLAAPDDAGHEELR